MTPAYILLMLKYAVMLSGYSMPNSPPPEIQELTHKEMVAEACFGHRPCNVYGFYRDNEVIKIDPWLIQRDHVSKDSIVVHELTHWLQQHHGKGGFSCKTVGQREREAYAVQNLYLLEIEHSYTFFKAPGWEC